MLQAGAAGLLGLSLADLFAARSAQASADKKLPGFGKAKRCIFLFMWGGPSQLDTFDMKPQAPDTVRSVFQPISTKVASLQICEHFQNVAGVMDKIAVIRSLSHDDPAHLSSGHTTVTGHLPPVEKSDATPPSSKDTPHLGSLLAKLRPRSSAMPPFVLLPWIAFHPAAPGGQAPGQHGGWLGSAYNPLLAAGDPNDPNWKLPSLALQPGMTPELLEDRYELLKQIDSQRAVLDAAGSSAMTAHQAKALGVLSSGAVQRAFDLSQEPAATRDRYGRNIHGQCVLLARRLIEHGVDLVCVNWHQDGKNFWDTHGNNFKRLKDELIPPADKALAALLTDLSDRGLLDDTIVAWVGEFGRKPEITKGNSGREHWPYCYSGLLAGGGIAGGAVYGASDRHAAYPSANPVTPHDYAATLLHALGVPAGTVVHDSAHRPHQVYAGQPIESLFG
jgi:hypothetical protein